MNSVAVTLLKSPTLSSSKSEEAHKKKSWGIKNANLENRLLDVICHLSCYDGKLCLSRIRK
jgi:hypothetical protein